MRTQPCAKINLGLYVVERRPDGYHNLETVFYPIPLCDELEINEAASDLLLVERLQVNGDWHENLVWKVVETLRAEGFIVPPIAIRLRKQVPMEAGLGGGSSDAAHTMKMLNRMFQLGLSEDSMEQRLARLGADCPFFVRCQPVFATGIGDQFTPISLSLSGLHLLLVKPEDHVSTREAYSQVQPSKPTFDLRESLARPIHEWQNCVFNDFERSVLPLHPTIAAIKQRLISAGALYTAMSGSGSAVFALFREAPSSELVASFAPHFTFTAPLP